MKKFRMIRWWIIFFTLIFYALAADSSRENVFRAMKELGERADDVADEAYGYYRNWTRNISEGEQVFLFKAEVFAASCRLFLRLTDPQNDFYRSDYFRSNLYKAFRYIAAEYSELDSAASTAGIRPYTLRECKSSLSDIDRLFLLWPEEDPLSHLNLKYAKSKEGTVYLIERMKPGEYVLRPFQNLESLWFYNYRANRDPDPWKYLVKISPELWDALEVGNPVHLSFEGFLLMESRNYPGRPVFLIQEGKKHSLGSPQVLSRLGGWKRVIEVPAEILNSYPQGDPIQDMNQVKKADGIR